MTTDLFFRVCVLVLLVSTVSFSGYFRAKAARDGGTIPRAEEGRAILLARMFLALPLLLAILVYVARPGWLEWARVALPPAVRWAGLGSGVVAVGAAVLTLASIGSNISPTVLTREGQHLVTRGPYRWIRHPLYVSGLLLLFSIGLMAENVFILGWVFMILVAVVAILVPREEKELVRRFGSEYQEYRTRTGALLPRPGSRG